MKTLLVLVTLAMFGTALVGCRAEGEIDDDMMTNVGSMR